MNEQEILRVGSEAQRFLDSEAFALCWKAQQDRILGEFFGSKPEEKRKREDLFLLNMAMEELSSNLKHLADAAASIRARDEESNNE